MLLRTAFALLSLAVCATAVVPIGLRWVQFGEYSYGMSSVRESFVSAESYCKRHGGHLASFHSQAEVDFIASPRVSDPYSAYWIGGTLKNLTYGSAKWSWHWMDGTAFDYVNWDDRQPDGVNANEKCMAMKKTHYGNGAWEDNGCWRTKPFICKRLTPVTTLPSTTTTTTTAPLTIDNSRPNVVSVYKFNGCLPANVDVNKVAIAIVAMMNVTLVDVGVSVSPALHRGTYAEVTVTLGANNANDASALQQQAQDLSHLYDYLFRSVNQLKSVSLISQTTHNF